MKSRYILITVDTEALRHRASSDYVKRLIWGEHDNGTAGVREMCSVMDEVSARMVFFVDVCGTYFYKEEMTEAITWLDQAGHDVQLHTHSEKLPKQFWKQHRIPYLPRMLNLCDRNKAAFVIRHFSSMLSGITGKPVLAYRAGSFRWNASTIEALKESGIALSFNNCMGAHFNGQCPFSEPANGPFAWSNGVIEVPMTERYFSPFFTEPWWGKLQFPIADAHANPVWKVLWPFTFRQTSPVMVMILHSWSLLHWDEKGHACYGGTRRIEELRKIVKRLAKDYDIITTPEFLDLYKQGKIKASRQVHLSNAEVRNTADQVQR